ncbi:uncharacterized protein LOC130898727 [Diorhabda carinulata]|uniref:uncharacterized protein LOC130898727 n=1 Tax=Diorhabda carinulata TaxID=1163345 RepID=UPI00259FE442|nr:uncharacterized protein LOC130898727 [Diorhabda carinulata]
MSVTFCNHKIRYKKLPNRCSEDNLSESSFLSERFCYEVLGKPCVDLKKKSSFPRTLSNRSNFNKNFKIPKQNFAVYNLMEESNFRRMDKSNQNIDVESEKIMEGSFDSRISDVKKENSKMNSIYESAEYIVAEDDRSTSRRSESIKNGSDREKQSIESIKNITDREQLSIESIKNVTDREKQSIESIKNGMDREKRSIESNMNERLSSTVSKDLSYPRSSFKPNAVDELGRLSNEPSPHINEKKWNKRYSKEGEISNRDFSPCYCNTDSQTSYPSILKQNRRSATSNIDKYPVKESRWSASKQRYVDAVQQTSDNRFVSNTNTKESITVPLVDNSVNTINTETASVQITELNSSKVQTTDSSTTPDDEVCFRPIQKLCHCQENRNDCLHYHKRDQNRFSASDRVVNIETNVTVPPIMSHVFRKPQTKHNSYTLPSETRGYIQGDTRNIRNSYTAGMPIQTDTSDLIGYSEDDVSDDYRSENGDVDRYRWYTRNNTECPKYFVNDDEKYGAPYEGCRCCQNRKKTVPITSRTSRYYRPRPPPIDYDLTSSEEDFYLDLDDNSDDNYFDYHENRPTRHRGLPYQTNDQYMDLVQELEETLQTRNKTRVQRARNEFEYKSRLNEPLEKPIIDYEEPSDSEETLIKKISELAEKRRIDHNRFPCKGKACCNCVLKNDVKYARSSSKPTVKPPKKKKKQWVLNNKTGEWYKAPSGDSIMNKRESLNKNHECGCNCKCGRLK